MSYRRPRSLQSRGSRNILQNMDDEMPFASHIVRRGRIYQYIRRVPEDLADGFPYSSVQRSLRTPDRALAYEAGRPCAFVSLRRGPCRSGARTPSRRLRRACVDRPGDVEARSALRPSVRLPRSQGRSHQMPLERRPGPVPVRQAARTGTVPVAVDGRRSGDDLGRAAGLSAGRHRLANAAENLGSDGGRLTIFAYKFMWLWFP